jgi:hypothetical protein
MDAPFPLAEKIVAAMGIGLLIGLEREWTHKEAGVRSFAIAALLGTVSWLVAPLLASLEVGVVVIVILFVNLHPLREHQPFGWPHQQCGDVGTSGARTQTRCGDQDDHDLQPAARGPVHDCAR